MDANQNSTSDEDNCSSDTDDKIRVAEEPATVAPPSVEGNIVHHSSHHTSSEVTGPPSKVSNLDEVTTPWKESTSKLCNITSQQSSDSTAHEGEQVCIYYIM